MNRSFKVECKICHNEVSIKGLVLHYLSAHDIKLDANSDQSNEAFDYANKQLMKKISESDFGKEIIQEYLLTHESHANIVKTFITENNKEDVLKVYKDIFENMTNKLSSAKIRRTFLKMRNIYKVRVQILKRAFVLWNIQLTRKK